MSGDIFDTEVVLDGSENNHELFFSFNVTDRDTRIDQLTITVTGQDDPFKETIKEPFLKGEPVYQASCETGENGEGVCTGSLIPDYYNASFRQLMTVTVDDGLYASERQFTLLLDREPPVLNDTAKMVQLESPTVYEVLSFTIDSATSAATSSNCLGLDYCHLSQNGYVDEWSWTNAPAWLACSEQVADHGSKVLTCTGRPVLGAAGTTQMQVTGTQLTGSANEKSDLMILSIEVVEPDTVADAFNFTSKGDIALDTLTESNAVTISGLTGYASLSLDKGEYWRNSTGVWSSVNASDIENGESIKLRLQSSIDYSTATKATLILGGVTAEFTVNTLVDPNANDMTPDAFIFQPATDQDLSTLVESNSVTISGINEPSPVTVVNGEYKIGLVGAWTQQAGTITNGENLLVRHTSAGTYDTETLTQLTIGGVSAEFSSRTQQLLAPLFGIMFVTEPMINTTFEFTPTNTGGAVESWSINNKPSWANFDTTTGLLSGTVDSMDSFTIDITATNAAGSDTFTTTVAVRAEMPPYINGYATDCSIDDDICDYTFTDNASWRASVTQVSVGDAYGGAGTNLSSPADYEITEGQIRLHFTATNQMVKSGGDYGITIQASNYNDAVFNIMVAEGEVVISNATIQPPLAAGTVSTISLHAANRFEIPVDRFYPELTQVNIDLNLVEQYQYRQVTDDGYSNIWKTFGGWNELFTDVDGNLSFDVKLPGCIDINDGFDLIAGNTSWIYRNIDEACIDVDWAIRYQLWTTDNRNIVVDSQHHLYRVTVVDYQLYLTKYDRNGLEMWVKALTSTGRSWFEGIVIYNDQLFITGSTDGDIDGAGSGQILGAYDLFVQRLDLDGVLVWSRQFGTVDNDYTYGMTINNDLIDVL
ncbi:MAG: putative Ig domain-containing protein, partial [Gammaproteobacteria bacterium]|nr:putative Ig domain-containing protein [Gammaproteobacteria bacterium]